MCLNLVFLLYQTLFELDQLLVALVIEGSKVVFLERGKVKPSVSEVILELCVS